MSYERELAAMVKEASQEIVSPILEQLKNLRLVVKDGRVCRGPFNIPDIDGPWVWNGFDSTRNCFLWKEMYFDRYGFISRNCFSCFKIFVRFDCLDELLKLRLVQREEFRLFGWVAKCGIETRPYLTHLGKYAGFWYVPIEGNDMIARGRVMADQIEADLTQAGLQLKPCLKRACSEMEIKRGPSSKWIYEAERHEFEDRLDALFNVDVLPGTDLDAFDNFKIARWISVGHQLRDNAFKRVDSLQEVSRVMQGSPVDDYRFGGPTIQSRFVRRGRND